MNGIEAIKALIDGKTVVGENGYEYYFLDGRLYYRSPVEKVDWISTLAFNGILNGTWEVKTIEIFGFSQALDILKSGRKVSREGWNGKGQYIEMQKPDEHSKMTKPYLYIKTVDGGLVPWLASQTDLLADDWYEID